MDQKTKKITQGALITAVFGVLVYLNRQTAGLFEGVMIYLYSLPITVYVAWYGLKAGITVSVAMALLSFILGTPTYAFYSCMCILIGLVFGQCLYKKASAEKTVLWVMLMSVIVNMLDLVAMVFISGISLDTEANQMLEAFDQAMNMMGSQMPVEATKQMEAVFSLESIKRILIISKALAGAIQGFIIYEIGLLIMRKLRINVPKPKAIEELKPPKWTAYVALGGFWTVNLLLQRFLVSEQAQNIGMIVSMMFYLYLVIFGVIGAYVFLKKRMPKHKIIAFLISLVGMLMLSYVMMIVGFLYISELGKR